MKHPLSTAMLVLAVGCGGASTTRTDWGDAGTVLPETGTGSGSSSGHASSSGGALGADSAVGAAANSGNASAGSGSGAGSSGAAGSGTPATSGSSGSANIPDASGVDSTGGNSGSSVSEAGVMDAAMPVVRGDASDPLAAARAQCVQIINQYRATLNPPSPPLQEATAQESCVDGQAKADYTTNKPHSAFGVCKEHAQDECPNWPGMPSAILTRCLAQMWAEGPPPPGTDNHWLNMSNVKYTKVACGFYQTPSGSWWATQDLW